MIPRFDEVRTAYTLMVSLTQAFLTQLEISHIGDVDLISKISKQDLTWLCYVCPIVAPITTATRRVCRDQVRETFSPIAPASFVEVDVQNGQRYVDYLNQLSDTNRMLASFMTGHSPQELNAFSSWMTTLDTSAKTSVAAFLGRNLALRSPLMRSRIQQALHTNTPSHLRYSVLRFMTDHNAKYWPTLVKSWDQISGIRENRELSDQETIDIRTLYMQLTYLGGESASTKRILTALFQTNIEPIIGRPGSCAPQRGHQSGKECQERGELIIGLLSALLENGPFNQSRVLHALLAASAILEKCDFWDNHPTYGQCLSIAEKTLCNRTNISRRLCGGTNPGTPRE